MGDFLDFIDLFAQEKHQTPSSCVSVSQSTLDKQVVRLETRVGSYTAWNMEFNLTDRCPVISPRCNVQCACCPTPLQSLRLGLVWITNSILCTPSGLSFTGMSEKVWKRASSPRLVKIWLLWRKITKRWVSTL